MPTSLHGKRAGQQVMAANLLTDVNSCLFFVTDSNSCKRFLVDTGAEVSVIPPNMHGSLQPTNITLEAANHSKIKTYGKHLMNLNLGLGRQLAWNFIVADVKFPILGADFYAIMAC